MAAGGLDMPEGERFATRILYATTRRLQGTTRGRGANHRGVWGLGSARDPRPGGIIPPRPATSWSASQGDGSGMARACVLGVFRRSGLATTHGDDQGQGQPAEGLTRVLARQYDQAGPILFEKEPMP
jgi:hypothetical protein